MVRSVLLESFCENRQIIMISKYGELISMFTKLKEHWAWTLIAIIIMGILFWLSIGLAERWGEGIGYAFFFAILLITIVYFAITAVIIAVITKLFGIW